MAQIYEQQIDTIVESIRNAFSKIPTISVMTNEPLSLMEQMITEPATLSYKDIKGLPTVECIDLFFQDLGDTATVKCGNYFNVPILLFNHFLSTYEGYSPSESALLIYALKKLGVEYVIFISESWSVDSKVNICDIVIHDSLINIAGMYGKNPLVGENNKNLGCRFPPMQDFVSYELHNIAIDTIVGLHYDCIVKKGCYVYACGPNSFTEAENKMFNKMGGKCAGITLGNEIVAAVHCGLKILPITVVGSNDYLGSEELQNGFERNSDLVKSLFLGPLVGHLVVKANGNDYKNEKMYKPLPEEIEDIGFTYFITAFVVVTVVIIAFVIYMIYYK